MFTDTVPMLLMESYLLIGLRKCTTVLSSLNMLTSSMSERGCTPTQQPISHELGDLPNFFTVAFSFLSSPTVWVVTTFLVLLWVPTAMTN